MPWFPHANNANNLIRKLNILCIDSIVYSTYDSFIKHSSSNESLIDYLWRALLIELFAEGTFDKLYLENKIVIKADCVVSLVV